MTFQPIYALFSYYYLSPRVRKGGALFGILQSIDLMPKRTLKIQESAVQLQQKIYAM